MLKKTMYLALFIASTAIYGQAVNVDLPMDYMQNNASGKNSIPSNVQGSPYFNEEFLWGTVFIKEEKYNADLRYNAYLDEVQAKSKGQIIALLKRDYVRAEIGNQFYVIVDYMNNGAKKQGYFVELNKGKTRLLKQQRKKFVEGRKAESTYKSDTPAKFIDQEDYFLKIGDQPAVKVKLKKKELLAHLGKEKEMQQYIADNGFKLKKVSEVIQLLNYHGTL